MLGLQISLLKRQMDEAATPSIRSRTSYHSIAIMAMGDGLMLTSLIAFSMNIEDGFLVLTSAGFLCFFNFAFFEMKFIHDIWLVQVGLHRREEPGVRNAPHGANIHNRPPQNQPSENSRPLQPSSQEESNMTPAPRPSEAAQLPVILPPDQNIETAAEEDEQEIRRSTSSNAAAQTTVAFQTLYSRFYFSMMVLVFFSVWAYSWPKSMRSAYVNLLCFAYLSFWVPQIHRNIMRNSRQAFTWEFVVGISVLRLLPILYCYSKESNTLGVDTDPFTALLMTGWMVAQLLALAIQQILGPRLFVRDSWCPPAYDYHPLLQIDVGDVESGSLLPIGFVASASEAKDKDKNKDGESSENLKIFDCAICMNEIEVPVVSGSDTADRNGLGASWLARRTYMVTPCRHIFHSDCLEGWMRFRLVCPICRDSLPPL